MYAVNAFAYLPSTSTPQATVASMNVPEHPAIGRLPTTTVAASLPYSELQPYNGGAGGGFSSAQPATALANASAAAAAAAMPTVVVPGGSISSFPSLFLTQLLGQGADAETQSLVVTYETMLSFSEVKYKPSNAALPQTASPMLDFMHSLGSEAAPANTNAQTPPPANLNAPPPPPPAAEMSAAQQAAAKPVATEPAPKASAKTESSPGAPRRSLIGGFGFSAYETTETRNILVLEQPEQELMII